MTSLLELYLRLSWVFEGVIGCVNRFLIVLLFAVNYLVYNLFLFSDLETLNVFLFECSVAAREYFLARMSVLSTSWISTPLFFILINGVGNKLVSRGSSARSLKFSSLGFSTLYKCSPSFFASRSAILFITCCQLSSLARNLRNSSFAIWSKDPS